MRILKEISIAVIVATAFIGTTCASAQTTSGTADNTSPPSKKEQRARNWKLEKDIRRALSHTKGIESSGITVLARGNVATLDGTVPSNEEIQLAGDTATGVQGVSSVKNNLTVREAGH